jgi:hypothetical protein
MNADRFQCVPLIGYEKTAATAVYELADLLQDLLFYEKCDDLPQATRTALIRAYRVLRSVADFYGLADTLSYDPKPGVPFKKSR